MCHDKNFPHVLLNSETEFDTMREKIVFKSNEQIRKEAL